MRIDLYHHFEDRDEVMRNFEELHDKSDLALERLESLMLDTSKILESARKQSTENASLRAALASFKEQLTTTKAELAAAIAANDTAATAAAQKDLDDLAALLDADDAETAAALAENVQPTA